MSDFSFIPYEESNRVLFWWMHRISASKMAKKHSSINNTYAVF